MKTAYIILDAMSTGDIPDVRRYLEQFNDPEFSFTFSNHYFEHESRQMDDYDLKYMLIDTNFATRFRTGPEYREELKRKIISASRMKFKIVLCNLWEDDDHHSHSLIQELVKQCGIETVHTMGGGRSYFWWMMYNLYAGRNVEVDHTHKEFDFLCLNKKPRKIRKYFYDLLRADNVLDKSLYTWWDDEHRIKLPPEYELPEYSKDYPRMGLDQTIHCLPYEHSKITVATETVTEKDNSPRGFMTEKIWKPIICSQPFLVLGYHHYLRELRKLGFRTFDAVWDESYDEITDSHRRAENIAGLMKSIKDMDGKVLYEKTADIREHNKNTFFDRKTLCDVITQDIKLAFGIY